MKRQGSAEDGDAAAGSQLRIAPRDSMLLAAQVRRVGSDWLPIKIRNLSSGGLMAETPVPFAREERIEVELRGIGQVGGYIAWGANGRIGVAFDRTIEPSLTRKPIVAKPTPPMVQIAHSTWRPPVR